MDNVFTHCEHTDCSVNTGKGKTRLSKKRFKISKVFDEWSVYFNQLATLSQEMIISGDLNFHFDDRHDDSDWVKAHPWPYIRCGYYMWYYSNYC